MQNMCPLIIVSGETIIGLIEKAYGDPGLPRVLLSPPSATTATSLIPWQQERCLGRFTAVFFAYGVSLDNGPLLTQNIASQGSSFT